jgi:hypothetical protein
VFAALESLWIERERERERQIDFISGHPLVHRHGQDGTQEDPAACKEAYCPQSGVGESHARGGEQARAAHSSRHSRAEAQGRCAQWSVPLGRQVTGRASHVAPGQGQSASSNEMHAWAAASGTRWAGQGSQYAEPNTLEIVRGGQGAHLPFACA